MRKISAYILILLLTGCFGKTDCPSFPESKLSWMPYQQNDILKFSNNRDTVSFKIIETNMSDDYSFPNNCDCICESDAIFVTDINPELDLHIEGHCSYISSKTIWEYNFIQHGYFGSNYVAFYSSDFYLIDENNELKEELINKMQLGSNTYKNVVQLEIDSLYDPITLEDRKEYYKIFIADSVGLVQFEDFNRQKIWTLVE